MESNKLTRTVLISLFIAVNLYFLFDVYGLYLSGSETVALLGLPTTLGLLTAYSVL